MGGEIALRKQSLLLAMLQPGFIHRIICDDSGDPNISYFLKPDFRPSNFGLRMARKASEGYPIDWESLRHRTGFNYIFHLEDDFIFNEPINLYNMIAVMERNLQLQQMSLLRQSWNEEEKVAGGIMQLHPEDFTEFSYGPMKWVEHRRYFTTNPCLYRRTLVDYCTCPMVLILKECFLRNY